MLEMNLKVMSSAHTGKKHSIAFFFFRVHDDEIFTSYISFHSLLVTFNGENSM